MRGIREGCHSALIIAVATVGLCGAWPAAVAGIGVAACPGPQAPATGRPNAATEAANPNAPMTRAQGAAILRELRAIRLLLQRGAQPGMLARQARAPHPVKMQIQSGWHALGSADAPVTMVEFADLQCPFCRRFETSTFAELKKDYIDTGKLRFVARDLPLPMHPYAMEAAEAARCAGDQGKFWQFRDAVLEDQVPPAPDVLLQHARGLGLNVKEFQSCLSKGKYKQQIQADRQDAAALDIHGTPAFVIGRVDGGRIEGLAITGARTLPFFQQEIESALNESPSRPARIHPAGEVSPAQGSGFVENR